MNVQIREAREADARALQEIYQAAYGETYCYRWVYEDVGIRRLILSDETVILVAEEQPPGRVVGTAAITMEIGAYSDLVGEFGRLVVHPDAQRRGIALRLMEARVRYAQDRLHVGLVEARAAHPWSQTVSLRNGFVTVGFLPLKLLFAERESAVLLVRYFGDALSLRRNNPRVIPEAHPLAVAVLESHGLALDAIVDEGPSVYPRIDGFDYEQLATTGYAALLRLERGRVDHREIFGPMRLHYGIHRLSASDSTYLLAKENGRIIGALGVQRDEFERTVRAFELIMGDDRPVDFLIRKLLVVCREQWGVEYVEVDMSAYAPRMQRTLLRLGFVPAAFVPALAFHRSERLDIVKMVYVFPSVAGERVHLATGVAKVRDLVLKNVALRPVLPRVGALIQGAELFRGLTEDQALRVAGHCSLAEFGPGETMFREGEPAGELYVFLEGEADIYVGRGDTPVGRVSSGECCGEMALLLDEPHSATAVAVGGVEAAALSYEDVADLVNHRPDIGVALYRNLGIEVARKLRRSDRGA
jgi:RimJ/RimL family protein N-acetyltransferase